jgi:Tetratricopeptide repeat
MCAEKQLIVSQETSPSDPKPSVTGRCRAAVWGLSLLCLLLLAPLIKPHILSPNDASRFGAMVSLAESGQYALHPSMAWTLDRALRDDGVFISDKPPFLNVLGAGVIRAASAVGLGAEWHLWIVTLFLSTLPAALALAFLGLMLCEIIGGSLRLTLLTMALCALTTLLTPYAVTLANHCLTACLVMALVLTLRRASISGGPRAAALLGLICGSISLFDIPTGIVLMGLTGLFALLSPRIRTLPFIAGLLLPVALGLAVNRLLVHCWLPVYFHDEMYDYPGSAWATHALDAPPYLLRVLRLLTMMTVGSLGVLVMWPLGIFALVGCWRTRRSGERAEDRIIALWTLGAWGLLLAALVLNPSPRGADSGSGNGLRWVMALMPPLMLFLPTALRSMRGWGMRTLITLTSLWGVTVVALAMINPWPANTISRFPPLHNLSTALAERDALPPKWGRGIIRLTAREPALALFDLGMIHFRARRHEEATPLLRDALTTAESTETREFDPNLARYYLGISLTELGLYPLADDVYRTLLESDPGNIGARNNHARCLLAWGQTEAALAEVEEALRRDPGNGSSWRLLVRILGLMGQSDLAVERLEARLAEHPGDENASALLETLRPTESP